MAEERIIDDDKDKKYRIKVNADGDEELEVSVPSVDEGEAPADETVYDTEEISKEDEAERKARLEELENLCDKAAKECKGKRFSTALEYLERAEELDKECGEIYALRVTAYTKNFTDFSQVITVAESAEGIEKYASDERKAQLAEKMQTTLDDNIASLRNKITALDKENEEKKAERAVRFIKDRNKALIFFCSLFLVFAGLLGTAISYATIIYTVNTGKYLVLTCVFGGLALIALVADAFAARKLNIACRRLRINKRNTSTQLGRELLSEQAKLKAFLALSSAVKVK